MATTTSQPALTGGCQCRAVTYTSTALPSELTNCHCSTCRKISGAPYLTFAGLPTDSLVFTSKPNALKTTRYSEMAIRTHCGECGSPISMQYNLSPEKNYVTAGSIDEESVQGVLVKPKEHIFLSGKAGWYEVPDDGMKRFERFPGAFEEKLEGSNTSQGKGT